MKEKKFFIWFVLGIALVVISCKKDNTNAPQINEEAGIQLRTTENIGGVINFSSIEEYITTRQAVAEMNSEERVLWQESMNFISYGVKQDAAYENLVETYSLDNVTSEASLFEIVSQHEDVLTLEPTEEDTEGIDYYVGVVGEENEDFYLMDNTYHMFIIENDSYRWFDNVLIWVPNAYFSNLKLAESPDAFAEYYFNETGDSVGMYIAERANNSDIFTNVTTYPTRKVYRSQDITYAGRKYRLKAVAKTQISYKRNILLHTVSVVVNTMSKRHGVWIKDIVRTDINLIDVDCKHIYLPPQSEYTYNTRLLVENIRDVRRKDYGGPYTLLIAPFYPGNPNNRNGYMRHIYLNIENDFGCRIVRHENFGENDILY
ncbi:MAG: hypothetical protein MJZ98_02325 [Paludibacteraceae bacterium]|nr:hypothetical protein [Paludibacteraceae bacterium]